MTNAIILSLLISNTATFHWTPSPDLSVTGYVMYASPVSRYTNERRPIQVSLPVLPGQKTNTLVMMRNGKIGTNENWRAAAVTNTLGNVTNWTMTPDSSRNYYAVAARDATGAESDLSNEVLFEPRWAFVDFVLEGSANMSQWEIMGRTNVLRFWCGNLRDGNIAGFFRARLVITNENK